ncbi:hypothetical protein C1646_668930 [Rhizophagus diaphanus]|nr:hypothetical protein C1646_668930 [Rhizophagus diaphanus] [Rhizophagus sp. MUCL 43196]
MAQLRADIHQNENEKKRKRDAEISKVNIAPPVNELVGQEIINVESQDDIERMLEDSQDNYITTVQDWNLRLEEWYELLTEEERAQNLAEESPDHGKLENDLLSSYTHPAVDINAKWDLRDLFVRELEKPEFISVSFEFD